MAPIPKQFFKDSIMYIPLSDRSDSSSKSEEVIIDKPHAGKVARVVLAGLSVSNNLASARRWRTSPNYSPFLLE